MDLERIFSLASAIAMTGWLFLVFVPRRPYTQAIAGVIAPLILAAIYLALIFSNIQGAEGGFGSLADVSLLFSKQELLLAGWVHYLALTFSSARGRSRDSPAEPDPAPGDDPVPGDDVHAGPDRPAVLLRDPHRQDEEIVAGERLTPSRNLANGTS